MDTGAYKSAMPFETYQRLIRNRSVLIKSEKAHREFVRVANNTKARIMARATLRMSFMGRDFEEEFLIIDNLTNTIMGIPFFAENDITIDCNTKRLHFANITAQLNEMMADKWKK